MTLQDTILDSLVKYSENQAYFINQTSFSYKDLHKRISAIQEFLTRDLYSAQGIIGLIINDSLDTYASIYAIWLSGKAYVPLSPEHPKERNLGIIEQSGIQCILDSSGRFELPGTPLQVINTAALKEVTLLKTAPPTDQNDLAYILFTSGTTGIPKGVKITYQNVLNFNKAYEDFGFNLNSSDRFLQMFQLTFDPSIMCFLFALLKGASVYTIPDTAIKYSYIVELLEDHDITIAVMVPSVIRYLRQYFDEIHCPALKYNLFCGEGLPVDVLTEWSQCVPNAKIENIYGPTENTIVCTRYEFDPVTAKKAVNGILSIGKPMMGTEVLIVDEENKPLPIGKKGELCLSGWQLTEGYWKNEHKNRTAFFYLADDTGRERRYYKTGDACLIDEEGDILYLGRTDFQAKIQGYRVELSEVEYYFSTIFNTLNIVAVPFTNPIGNTEIGLVLESESFDVNPAIKELKEKLPPYMIPTQYKFVPEFPLNISGKIDRNTLIKSFENDQTGNNK